MIWFYLLIVFPTLFFIFFRLCLGLGLLMLSVLIAPFLIKLSTEMHTVKHLSRLCSGLNIAFLTANMDWNAPPMNHEEKKGGRSFPVITANYHYMSSLNCGSQEGIVDLNKLLWKSTQEYISIYFHTNLCLPDDCIHNWWVVISRAQSVEHSVWYRWPPLYLRQVSTSSWLFHLW